MWIRSLDMFHIAYVGACSQISMSLERTSMTRSKRIGERGSPCFMPLWFLKKGVGVPSTKTKKDAEEMQLWIILQKGCVKPIASSVAMIVFKIPTMSKAFLRSMLGHYLFGVLIHQVMHHLIF